MTEIKTPYFNKIRIGDLQFGPAERAAIIRVLDSGRISEGPEVRAFEREYADWLGARHCVAVSSGTAALIVGLAASQIAGHIKPGARVLMPALTFIATANAVRLTGLEPVFADIDPHMFTMRKESLYWNQHDAILPVHLFGYPAPMDYIIRGARTSASYIPVFEDACQAHGSRYIGSKVGCFGHWSAFSFYIAHTVQAGEFGVLCTDDPEIAKLAKSLKAHGRACACEKCNRSTGECPFLGETDPRFTHLHIGYNFKPMEWQAALARVQLENIEENIEKRRANVSTLNSLLRKVDDRIKLPTLDGRVSYMAYPMVLLEPGRRAAVMKYLESHGVECRPLFGCIPTQQPAYEEYAERYQDKLPVAEDYGANGLYVGCHQYLEYVDLRRMAGVIIDAVREKGEK
jgi:CDP-6-deoxy-D-xylo-4-hexulose-3-dehydrase